MKAFLGKESVKKKYLARVKAHRIADEIVKGRYWEDGKGCAIGCTIHSFQHSTYETELGIPEWLARVEDMLFEGVSNQRAKVWPEEFLKAIPVGADLERIKVPFIVFILRSSIASMRAARFNRGNNPDVCAAQDQVEVAIEKMIQNYENGVDLSAAESVAESVAESAGSAAESAGSAAWSARSVADAARSAAWSVAWRVGRAARNARSVANAAESVARSVSNSAENAGSAESAARNARSVANAAESVARSVSNSAESAAESAALAAESAALAAESAALAADSAAWSAARSAADAARSAAYEKFADKLLELFGTLKSTNHRRSR